MDYRYFPIILFSVSIFTISGCDTGSADPDEYMGMFPQSNIEDALSYSAEENPGIALLIWQDGELLLEKYEDIDSDTPQRIFSGSKSMAGLLTAIAVRDGHFTFESKLGDLITEWDPETVRGSITIRELLNLTSGIQTAPIGTVVGQNPGVWLNLEMAFEKGTIFTYGPTPFYLLSYIFIEELGINPEHFLNLNLFSPLGLPGPVWDFPAGGRFTNLSFGARYSARNWLQTGILLMNKGSLDGIEIIPEEIFNQLLQPGEAGPAYGITFWLNEVVDPDSEFASRLPGLQSNRNSGRMISDNAPADLFMKSGALGQKLYISPSLNLVIVRLGRVDINTNGAFADHDFFTRLFRNVNIPAP